jgi:hypothetical protein
MLGLRVQARYTPLTGAAPLSISKCQAGTGTKSMSLGKAIQTLDPQADHKAESKKGETEAQQDIKSRSDITTPSTPVTNSNPCPSILSAMAISRQQLPTPGLH